MNWCYDDDFCAFTISCLMILFCCASKLGFLRSYSLQKELFSTEGVILYRRSYSLQKELFSTEGVILYRRSYSLQKELFSTEGVILYRRSYSLQKFYYYSYNISVVILAEDTSIQQKLADHDLKVQTVAEVSPIQLYPARILSHLFSHLGQSVY